MVDAREYHERSNHTVRTLREEAFELDFSNRPRPYKVYEDLEGVEPASERAVVETPALAAVAQARADPVGGAVGETPGDPDVHSLCYHATGVTKTLERGGERTSFRAASCTGKLYHVDLYAVAGDCGEFAPGVYHYDPPADSFDVLREGDYRGVLAAAAGGGSTGVSEAPVTFVATSTWWRNAWKYRERTYRHAFWDAGTIVANLLAAAHGSGHRAEVVVGFADDPVVSLLGLDPAEEAPLELIPVGSGRPAPDAPAVEPIDPTERPLSDRVVEYPLNPEAWRQSTLENAPAVDEWRARFRDGDGGTHPGGGDVGTHGTGGCDVGTHDPGDGELVHLDPVDAETASGRPLTNTVERRGSLREFAHDEISDRLFATVLDRALRPVPTDCFGHGIDRLTDVYCLVHGVAGVEPGAYQYHPAENALERVGDTGRAKAGDLALGQSVVGDAAANVYLLADVERVVERFGNRGYRLAQLEAGVALGRLYLATYAHRRIGGRGFTFFDEQVREHLSPRAANQLPMTLFAFGKPPT